MNNYLFAVNTATEDIFFRTIETNTAAFLLGVVATLYFLFVFYKIPDKWNRTNNTLTYLARTDRAYKKIIIKLAKKGINLEESETSEL